MQARITSVLGYDEIDKTAHSSLIEFAISKVTGEQPEPTTFDKFDSGVDPMRSPKIEITGVSDVEDVKKLRSILTIRFRGYELDFL